MIQCIAIDDEPLALQIIEDFCSRVPYLDLQNTFSRTSEAEKHLNKASVDLLFLDIQMPDILGIDFYKGISKNTMVIFTTAFSEYAIEGFNVSAIDFLLKPFDFIRFLQACEKAKEYHMYLKQSNIYEVKHLFVRSEYSLVKIPFADILYIETMDDYIKIHQLSKKPILSIISMKKVMMKLPAHDFIRVHRSYIVPLNRIESVRGKIISIEGVQIPIGINYEEEFFNRYKS
ncbi:MAG: response regulator transcription factor [Chitinophagales bacterium]|nr:response regulator transcription factor [Chitinophagales bacterium]